MAMPRRILRPRPPLTFASARALAEHLDARWFRLAVSPAGMLLVRPARWVTPADRAAIAVHRDALIALVRDTPAARDTLRFFHFDPTQAAAPMDGPDEVSHA